MKKCKVSEIFSMKKVFDECLQRPNKTRQEINREILKLLSAVNEIDPDQRFGQLLYNLDVVTDEGISYGQESSATHNRVVEAAKNFIKE